MVYSNGRLDHNTIVANQTGDGVGVHADGDSAVDAYNNIVVSHTVGIVVADPGVSTVTAAYTLLEANGTDYGPGVSSSHEVAGPAGLRADYHLGSGSHAVDQGFLLTWVTTDIDGQPRPAGPAVDVGADEVWRTFFLPLTMRNAP
jgi:hypothetical protein